MHRTLLLALLAVSSAPHLRARGRDTPWTAGASCTPMSSDQLATYLAPGQTVATIGSFTTRARVRDSCTQYAGCSPWLDPAPARMTDAAGAAHELPASGQAVLYAGASTISLVLTNREPRVPDKEIRMRFAELAPGELLDRLGERGSFEIELLQQPLGGTPPMYAGSVLAWEGSMTGSTHFTGRLCADGSFHLVSVLTDGLGLDQYAIDGQLGH